jgi:phosphatidylinositol glycan class H protein
MALAQIAVTPCQKTFVISTICHIAQHFVESAHVAWRLTLYVAASWLALRRGSIEESLLVVRGLGVQTTSTGSSWLATNSTRFIPTSAIQDILIHEAFKGFEVRFYMAIVVAGGEEVVVVFPVRS